MCNFQPTSSNFTSFSSTQKTKQIKKKKKPHVKICLNVCVFPKFTGWNPNPQSNGIRRGGLWKMIRSWTGLATRKLIAPAATGGHSKMTAFYKPESGPSTYSESVGSLTMDLNSRTVRNKFLLFLNQLVYGSLLWQPKWTKVVSKRDTTGRTLNQFELIFKKHLQISILHYQ